MKKAILYVHGKGGNPQEGERYRGNCPGFDIFGADYRDYLPWNARQDIRRDYEALRGYDVIYLIANSIGAFFSMLALQDCKVDKALFISPILDMEQLITDMMGWAGVTEDALKAKGEIETDFGETLSWAYLQYVRENPICWDVPTEILYAGRDNLTSRQTVDAFVASHNAGLTVKENGEHWFHTGEQLAFLDGWMKTVLS